jgi:hypothetical protein
VTTSLLAQLVKSRIPVRKMIANAIPLRVLNCFIILLVRFIYDFFDSHQSQIQRVTVAIKPRTFTHMGKEHPSINTVAPVIILSKWINATIPKIVPEMRKPSFMDFITDNGFLIVNDFKTLTVIPCKAPP